ncbi:unnamed protein product [Malus baccata var. baccata]
MSLRILTPKPKRPSLLEICSGDLNPKRFYQLVSHAVTSGVFSTDSFVSNKLRLLSLSHRRLEFSRSLFSQIQNPNLFACNFIFKAFSLSSCPQEALFQYDLVRRRYPCLLPDNYSFPFHFKACGRLSLPYKGQELHAFTVALGLQTDVFVQKGLVSMYSACGLLHSARKVFDFLPFSVRDVVSWNSIVSGYLQSNRNRNALQPDNVTLVSAFTACGKMGCLHLGRQIHGSVFYTNISVKNALIDMYSKCGDIIRALEIFHDMRTRCFYMDCHDNWSCYERGLCWSTGNVFTNGSVEWHDVSRMRKGVALQGARKQLGCSLIEIDCLFHEFIVADCSQCQIDSIYETVRGMNKVIRSERFD